MHLYRNIPNMLTVWADTVVHLITGTKDLPVMSVALC